MPLTDVSVRQARPKEKEYKLSDERGLLLVVRPNGAKWWRLRYQFQGKEKMISLGVYPDVSLSMARDRRDAARRLVADGKDPSAERQGEKQALKLAGEATFERIARHYRRPISAGSSKRRRSSITPLFPIRVREANCSSTLTTTMAASSRAAGCGLSRSCSCDRWNCARSNGSTSTSKRRNCASRA